jgi:membrane-associated protease RseP (regulator of RpoE activity)
MTHLTHRMLVVLAFCWLVVGAQAEVLDYDSTGDTWSWAASSDESGSGSSYLGVDIADVTAERLGELKLKEEHGAEITMVDQDAPAGKAGLHQHDVVESVNGTPVESAAQLRRMIKETPPGRVVTLGISRDGQPMTIKVQLADRKKAMSYMPNVREFKFQMPDMPTMPDFEPPVSVVIAHSSLRSGLMVENLTPQLGEFFGVKNGKGVLVRSVEKGSRAEKAGFHAGDVVVKVNDQVVHDASDFTHALRAASGGSAAVIVVREKKEQNLTLTLPARRESGSMIEDSLDIDCDGLTAESEKELSRLGDQLALQIGPVMEKVQRRIDWKELQKKLEDLQRKMKEQQEKLHHEVSGEWTEL